MSIADPTSDNYDVSNAASGIPPLIVDGRLLQTENRIGNVTANQITYKINESVFVDKESEDNGLVEFEVYGNKVDDEFSTKMDHDYDMYCSTPTESESECEDEQPGDKTLPISIQNVPHGIIVNSNVYLTSHQWNTLIFTDVKMVQCAVCDLFSDLDTCPNHVGTDRHKRNLDLHKPLERFDLSITRKIRNKYHCAVCNELFDSSDNYDHFGSKMHEGNLLFAINKASDITYDYNIHDDGTDKKDCYHFNENNIIDSRINDGHSINDDLSSYSDYTNNENYINYQNNYFYNDFDDYEEIPTNTGTSYATMAKKPKINLQKFIDIDLGNKKVKVRFDSWHMIISPKLNRFYCMVCKKFDHMRLKPEHCSDVEHLKSLDKCKVVEAYEEYFIRQVDDKLYHCGHCNNLQLIHEMEDHVETNHLRKNKIFTDASHTPVVASPVKNINNNEKHTQNSSAHNQNNGVSTPVKSHDKTIRRPQSNDGDNDEKIRKPQNDTIGAPVSCKTIQRPQNNGVGTPVIHQPHNADKLGSPVKYYDKTIKRPILKLSNINNEIVTNANGNSLNDRNKINDAKMLGIFDNIVIFPFGFKLTISMMSYNIVCRRPNDFYCALCDIICPEDVIYRHIYEIRHIELLQRTPFINPFSYNLIRAIREALHCAICNMPVSAVNIYEHIREPAHVDTLSKAIGVVPSPINIPAPNVKTAPINATGAANAQTYAADVKTANNGVIMSKIVGEVINAMNDGRMTPSIQAVAEPNITNDLKADSNDRKSVKGPIRSNEVDLQEELDDNLNVTFDSTADENVTFDMEEYVYLKLRNSYIKIANTSYNTLVHVGDGSRYCFVCNLQVDYVELQKHVDSRGHLENMEKYRFLDKYEDHLLRQIFLMYHCCICNVIITRKELKTHLEWPTHALQNENTMKNIKKTRKNEIKGGVKQIVVSTQKENIYLNEKETKVQIHFNVEITDKADCPAVHKNDTPANVPDDAVPEASKKNKIIILKDNVVKVSWESWHGVSKIKNGFKCNLCQRELQTNEIDVHCSGEWHKYALDKPFEKQYAPALIRKINELTLNCVICNTEVSNKEHIVTEHINGKKHAKNYEAILKDSSETNTYVDCDDDVLML